MHKRTHLGLGVVVHGLEFVAGVGRVARSPACHTQGCHTCMQGVRRACATAGRLACGSNVCTERPLRALRQAPGQHAAAATSLEVRGSECALGRNDIDAKRLGGGTLCCSGCAPLGALQPRNANV
jgi:hypothetical protein